jgi:hypothetical protein
MLDPKLILNILCSRARVLAEIQLCLKKHPECLSREEGINSSVVNKFDVEINPHCENSFCANAKGSTKYLNLKKKENCFYHKLNVFFLNPQLNAVVAPSPCSTLWLSWISLSRREALRKRANSLTAFLQVRCFGNVSPIN